MNQYVEIVIIYLLRIVLRVLYLFPVKRNKIIFTSFAGKQYSCNPKYIFEYMINRYGSRFEYVWCLNDITLLPEKYAHIKTVKYLSAKYVWQTMTAEIIIDNSLSSSIIFPLRRSQKLIFTHHGGGAYKKSNNESVVYRKRAWSLKIKYIFASKSTKYTISACKKFTEEMSKILFMPSQKFLSIGMPRNDIFFLHTKDIRQKVRRLYQIDTNSSIILYAPTYRGDGRNSDDFDSHLLVEPLLEALKMRFIQKFVFFYRPHSCGKLEEFSGGISVSDYPDMQELLCTADVLITDYSSSIWDFSFTYKPCFLYCPDLKKYENEAGFLTPIEQWGFPLAKTNEELVKNILEFEEGNYRRAMNKHHADLGSYEKGTASEQLCSILKL